MHSGIYADALLRSVALAIARNQVGQQRPITELLPSEGITQQEYDDLSKNPQFKQYVDAYAKELTESGFSFAAKSRVLAEDLLPMAYKMAKDGDVPAPVRAKMIENLVEWGDLKPRKDVALGQVGSGFSITINIPDSSPLMATKNQPIDITPKSVEKVLNEPQESVGKKLNVHSSIHSSENVQLKKQIAVLDCESDDDYYDAEAEE
jgi:hypothetical protein